jgi:hypothetical protein
VFGILKPVCKPGRRKSLAVVSLIKSDKFIWTSQGDAAFKELKKMLAIAPNLPSPTAITPTKGGNVALHSSDKPGDKPSGKCRSGGGKRRGRKNRAEAGILSERSALSLSK